MSQQENENMKKDLHNEDATNSDGNSDTNKEFVLGSASQEKDNSENKNNSGVTESQNAAENKDKDHLEKAMIDESEVSSSQATKDTEEKMAATSSAQLEDEDEDEEELAQSSEKKDIQTEFEDTVAEDSEDETTSERHSIEKKDYHAMSKEELVKEFEHLVSTQKVQAIKEHVEEIKSEFNAKFDEEVEEKKEDFLAEGGNIIDFHYSTPIKKQFNSVYFDYKEKRNNYYQQLKQDLNKNLNKRLEIVEELKGLLDVEENINTTYKHFKELQDRWRTAGSIPRDKYNTVWNTYHHHVENFYDFLHLNRDFRDLDFKHNLEQKLKIIDRAEELTQEKDTSRAFRELQMLHKMWKEELGPVAKEYRDDIWNKFSEATKKIHDLRQSYYDDLEKNYEKNLEIKQEIITKIKSLSEGKYTSHNQWQQQIKELETLREQFFKAGKVPREKNEATWSEFKSNVRQFNRNKNAYYKGLKKEQYDNLERKKELIKIAEDNKDNEDFKATTPLMKKIQADWKKVGHVPRKDSDKVWKQFKAACNHYFNRMHENSNEENAEEMKAFDEKKEMLDSLKSFEFSGDKKTDLPKIKTAIEDWKNIGRVPFNKRFIEGKFNKLLDQLFSKLDVSNTKAEMMKYENKIQALNDADDDKKLRNEHYFLSKKVEETKAEIRQLENNLQFFSNVKDDNPLVKEVLKNIENHKEDLKIWKEKLKAIKSLY
ncbi:protein of unknown function [Gillisia sp. Hel1_33_143]|uniref:DUF349 domain-containing protein n=1 Tax=Gillisia sp. Hel1_33_143 TaxID=1336796 RepID=UPI00087938F8|nr:DUF349 domain-containing protein [Gillisia sp. Hel1_33_143]SDS42289.1 protein of unknown function [Gillisia sp. Hel1_33_143]